MKRKRTYDEIHADRFQGSGFMAYYPAIHTPSGCRFAYTTQVDYFTYESIKARREEKAREELDRELRMKELQEKDRSIESKLRSVKRKQYKEHREERLAQKKIYREAHRDEINERVNVSRKTKVLEKYKEVI